jgi:glycosyltransferase involved in cell wall biosynthesis
VDLIAWDTVSRPAVVLNGLALQPRRGGVSTYIEELSIALGALLPHDVARVRLERRSAHLTGTLATSRWFHLGPAVRVAGAHVGARCTVFHALHEASPLARRGPTVVTVHDLAMFDVPRGPATRLSVKRAAARHAIRTADTLIAVSTFTAERIEALFGRHSVVIPLAPRPSFTPASAEEHAELRTRYGLPDAFALAIATQDGRKAVGLLGRVATEIPELPIVTVGPSLFDTATPTAEAATVRHLGYVSTGDLRLLYSCASVVLYASEYEGFGLPPFESLACGTPVVATRVGAIEDHLAGRVHLVDLDAGSIAAALASSADAQVPGGPVDGPDLRWELTAAATADVYRALGAAI